MLLYQPLLQLLHVCALGKGCGKDKGSTYDKISTIAGTALSFSKQILKMTLAEQQNIIRMAVMSQS